MTTCTTTQEQLSNPVVTSTYQTPSGILAFNGNSLHEGMASNPALPGSVVRGQAPPDLFESAKHLHDYGFNVIPVKGKKPIGSWKQYQKRFITLEEMESLPWEEATGIAVINGVGGIRNLDIDLMGDDSILTECLSLMGLPSAYPWVERSGFGSHILFVCSDNPELTVEKRDVTDGRADHFEKRWSNCYTVIAPSAHYDKQ